MHLRHLIAAGAVLLVVTGRGGAQFPQLARGPSGPAPAVARPAFSPYLNLTRQDVPAGINYYGLVRPQLATQQSLQGLQQQITTVQQGEVAAGSVDPGLPVTGQPVYFLNTGGYFLNHGVGPTAAGRGRVLSTGPTNPGRPAAVRSR